MANQQELTGNNSAEVVRITSANNSIQIAKKFDNEWTTTKVLDSSGLAKGTYHLVNAVDPSKSVHPQKLVGPVVHVDNANVFQIGRGEIVKHNADLFADPPKVGQCFEVAYRFGRGTVKGELTREASDKLVARTGVKI